MAKIGNIKKSLENIYYDKNQFDEDKETKAKKDHTHKEYVTYADYLEKIETYVSEDFTNIFNNIWEAIKIAKQISKNIPPYSEIHTYLDNDGKVKYEDIEANLPQLIKDDLNNYGLKEGIDKSKNNYRTMLIESQCLKKVLENRGEDLTKVKLKDYYTHINKEETLNYIRTYSDLPKSEDIRVGDSTSKIEVHINNYSEKDKKQYSLKIRNLDESIKIETKDVNEKNIIGFTPLKEGYDSIRMELYKNNVLKCTFSFIINVLPKLEIKLIELHNTELYYGHKLKVKLVDDYERPLTNYTVKLLINDNEEYKEYTTDKEGIILTDAISNLLPSYKKTDTSEHEITINYGADETDTIQNLNCNCSHNYTPSIKYDCRISKVISEVRDGDTTCQLKHKTKFRTAEEIYSKWYDNGEVSREIALYKEGIIHSYLAESSASNHSCKTPELLKATTDGKDFDGNAKKGTVLGIGYETANHIGSGSNIFINGWKLYLFIKNNGVWTNKETIDKKETVTKETKIFTGDFTKFVPTMEQLNNECVMLVCDFASNTNNTPGYLGVNTLYPYVYYTPTQTFKEA